MIICFWNVNKNKSLDNLILELVQENKIDILALAEYDNDTEQLCKLLDQRETRYKPLQCIGCDKIKGIYNSKYTQKPLKATSRYIISTFSTVYSKLLLGAIHGPAMPRKSDDDRRQYYSIYIHDIEQAESESGINNTILIGDFNSSPFDGSIVRAGAIHAIPHKEEASKNSRIVDGHNYKTFYNPTWKLLALDKPPYGTYYYNNSNYENYYWYLFDQVIVRPGLINSFQEDSLRIITEINDKSLLKNDYSPDIAYSDHLPIIFEIQEEKL